MNILFNASQCNLGPNGGTKTIIRCAETLQDMGHNVAIWAEVNKYTWHKPKVKILKCGELNEFEVNPNNCTMVNVSVWETISRPVFYHNTTYWYMRGWESWVHGEYWLIQQIKKFVSAGGRIIVNSSWLMDQLKEKCGVDSVLCYAGLDLDVWARNNEDRENYSCYDIGGLHYRKHKTKRSDILEKVADWAIENNKKIWYTSISSGHREDTMRMMYSTSSMWILPTQLEGFSQVGAEAGLCGSLLVCNRMKSNGTNDFATDETAMRYDNWEELIECIENPDFSKVPNMQRVLREKIGNREWNMKKFVEILNS